MQVTDKQLTWSEPYGSFLRKQLTCERQLMNASPDTSLSRLVLTE